MRGIFGGKPITGDRNRGAVAGRMGGEEGLPIQVAGGLLGGVGFMVVGVEGRDHIVDRAKSHEISSVTFSL